MTSTMKTKTKLGTQLILIGMTLITSQNSSAVSLTPVTLSIPSSTITSLPIPLLPPVIAPVSVTPPPVTYTLQATPISIGYVVLKANKGEVSLCKPPVSINSSSSTETPSCWFIDTVYPSLSGATLTSQPGSNTALITNNDNGTVWACSFAILPGATQASGACTGIADMSITAPAVTQLW
jgi:hypothetical protein